MLASRAPSPNSHTQDRTRSSVFLLVRADGPGPNLRSTAHARSTDFLGQQSRAKQDNKNVVGFASKFENVVGFASKQKYLFPSTQLLFS